MFSKSLLTTSLLLTLTHAHQNFQQISINAVSPGPQIGIRMPPSNSPVTDLTSSDMACNVPSTSSAPVKTLDAAAGDSITVKWDNSGHPGPITHFLKKVDDAATDTGVGAGWFKIDEVDYEGGKWASEIMAADGMTHEFKLPSNLAGGEYLLRSEMLALHSSQTLNGAQFYIGCAQLKIAGTGSASCGPTISLPGAYKADDANIYIPNYYNGFDATTYKAPGGPVATCGGSGAGAGNQTVPVASPVAEASASASATPAAVETPGASASPVASSVPTPAPSPSPSPSTGSDSDSDSGALPATFTMETFIAWLEGKASGSASKVRRHARSFLL